MPIPETEALANKQKEQTDEVVSMLLGLDKKLIREIAKEVAVKLSKPYKIIVCGGSGSSKTTFSTELGDVLNIRSFDFDKYIEGGWTSNKSEYKERFKKALSSLWSDLGGSWIVEHVEACSPILIQELDPRWAINLNPGRNQLRAVALLRDAVSGESGEREARAISSLNVSTTQFKALKGKVIAEGMGWVLKELK